MPKELLVIDDEPMLCKALDALFTGKGFQVATANSAREALSRLDAVPADVILLDLKLPDASGLDVLSTLKERFPNVRVIVISALSDQPTIKEAMERGASDYLAKPFDFDRCFAAAMGLEAGEPAAEPTVAEEPLVEWLDALLRNAHAHRATDLHLGTGPKGPWIRQRIDGVLYEVPMSSQWKASYERVVSQLKQRAGLDVAQRRLPQQGRIRLDHHEPALDLRLSVLPTPHGEHLAIRLLSPSQPMPFEKLGMTDDQRLALVSLLAKPSGLLFVTGPAGCGKSATLASCLAKLNTGKVNIVTVEESVEQEFPGVTQMPIAPKTGLTFTDGLRAAAHHDPDVVMVGELHDQDTAALAVRAALAGRLVLAGMHTADASGTITRLMDLDIEPFFLCSTLSGILAQRLVRTLCTACREPYQVEAASLSHLGVSLAKPSGDVTVWRAKGCKECRTTGYHGRTGVFELLAVDHQIRSLIIKRTSGIQIRQSAVSRGMMTLLQAVWQKVQNGTTSLEELIRISPREPHV